MSNICPIYQYIAYPSRFGKAIDVGAYRDKLSDDGAAQDVAKTLMSELEQQMFALTVNARDW